MMNAIGEGQWPVNQESGATRRPECPRFGEPRQFKSPARKGRVGVDAQSIMIGPRMRA
jgi:hypothetical protein